MADRPLRRWLLAAQLPIAWLLASAVHAQPPLSGPEFQINTYTTENQYLPAIASAANGDFVVVWSSYYQDGEAYGVFGQRYASNGTPAGTEFQVNSYTTYNQLDSVVAAASNGDFVVVWSSYEQDGDNSGIFGQRYDSGGSPQGTEFQVNSYTTYSQQFPDIDRTPSGEFVVVWTSYYQDGDSYGIFGQRFASDGNAVGTEFQVNSYTDYGQDYSAVAMDPTGNFVVVWHSSGDHDGAQRGIFGQRFDSAGSALGTEFQVNTYTTSNQRIPDVAAAPNGDFVVAWESNGQDGYNTGIFAQRYASDGTPAGTEFQVNTYTTQTQSYATLAVSSTGDFVVMWNSFGQDGYSWGIFGRHYASNGSPLSSEFQVNTYTNSSQFNPAVAWSANGDFVVAWHSYDQDGDARGIFGQRFSDLTALPTATGTATPTATATATQTATATATATITATPTAGAGCAATPLSSCAVAAKSRLLIKDKGEDGAGPSDKLTWKWLKGPETMQADFGNPTTTANYNLCIYSGAAQGLTASVPFGTGWSSISTKGYKYSDPLATVAGIKQIHLTGGAAGKTKILVKGKDGGLGFSASLLPFGMATVTVQLSNSQNANCWESTFSPATAKNTEGLFKAKSP